MKIHFHLLFLIFLLCYFNIQSIPLTPETLTSFNRLSSPVLSPDGKYVIYSKNYWNITTGKSYSHLQYTEISTSITTNLTSPIEDQSDTSASFSTYLPNHIIFTRTNKEVSSQLFYIPFPSTANDNLPVQLTKYPITIKDYKIKKDSIVFSADVYFNCTTLNCSADLIKKEKNATYQTYDSLLMFHWDKWLVEGKGSHLFIQKIEYNKETNEITLKDEPRDLTSGMELNTPPLYTDNSNYDISPDGTKVAFSAHLRTHDEAWSTSWKTYYIDTTEMVCPVKITNHTNARTQYPKFSKDGEKFAYLAMKTPMLESEFLHFEIYNVLTNKINIIDDSSFDKSVNAYFWKNDNEIIFTTTDLGQTKIFNVNIKNLITPKYTQISTDEGINSYGLPLTALKNPNVMIVNKVGYDFPERLVKFSFDGSITEDEVVNLNKDILDSFELPKPEKFSFIGGYNDSVQGWLFKPINFDESKKYPVILMIHGGPESSYTSGWSYTWNPQIFTNNEYVVVMINPHGSSGVNSKFQDAVRNDWGGVPYDDLMTGLDYVLNNTKYTDKDKMCAIGGSYGGYMVNWIEGQTDRFKCLINHDGAFSTVSKFYGTDELWFQKAEFCEREKIGCNPFDGPEERIGYEKFSPERYVKNWNTPMLVIHGGKDMRVPLTEALQTFTSLQLKNIKSKFLYFPLEIHGVVRNENRVYWYNEVIAWFKENMP